MLSTNSTTSAAWDADLIALRDEIFSQGGVTIREAAQMACNSIGMLEAYAAEWDRDADELLLLAYAPVFCEEVQYELTAPVAIEPTPIAPRTPADRAYDKATYLLSQGLRIVETRGAFLVPSGSRNNIIHRVADGRCSCEAGQNGRSCWHVAAVALATDDRMAA